MAESGTQPGKRTQCVIYARVSTKEQQEEGYSIPAQLKAVRAFCDKEGLEPVEEFVEAQSAGKAGRKGFGRMVAFLREQSEVRVVVAHKLDRLYRNFADQVRLEEELGIPARYVVGDVPASPQGELLRDVQLSVAKFYLGNLREEVKKGMEEKASQGGWATGRAPLGYVNDKRARRLVVDPLQAPFVRHAFERYATGLVSLGDLADELHERGLQHLRSGHKVHKSSLHLLLQNPVYCGLIRYKNRLYRGQHEAIISPELFERVQRTFEPNRNGNMEQRHLFALRDFLWCGDCGCKITAERHRGHVYYRCTKGKGKEACSQRSYSREEDLMEQVEQILASIEIGPDLIAALVEESRLLDQEAQQGNDRERESLERAIGENDRKAGRLLDSYLEGIVDADTYRRKAEELSRERFTFEQRSEALANPTSERTACVEELAKTAASARIRFTGASVQEQREVLATVLSNATLQDQELVDFQLKSPYEVLVKDSEGALCYEWWAILDLNQ